MSLRLGRCGLLLGAITAIALLPDCGGKASTVTPEGPTGEVEASVSGECTAELESIAPSGGQRNPALGATLVAKAASCMRGTPARYRFIAKSPNTGTSLVACDWQLGRTCRWNTSALAERGLWMVQVETGRDGQSLVDGRSGAMRYAVGGVCRAASVVSASPASASVEPGSNVSVTVSATCDAGVTPQYALFATPPGGAATQVGAWSSSPGPFTWSTTGLPQGRYTLEARVRQAGSTVDYEANATSIYTLGRYVCDAPVATAPTSGSTRAIAISGVSCTSGAVPQARFTLKSPTGSTSLLQDWSTTTSHNWNVAGLDGTWRVVVDVRAQQTPTQAIGSTTVRAALGAACTATPSAPLAGASPVVRTAGATIPLTASEAGCTPEFKYQVNGFGGWTTVCDWSTSASCSFNSSTFAAGSYAVQTLVRKSGSTDIDYEAASSPLTLILDANQDGDAYSISQGDCHDGNAAVHPGATETCNDLDDNCNGTVDEGVAHTYYVDADGDGYGDPAGALSSCSALSGFVSSSTDCDDTVATVHPGTAEICGNAVDENCDGLAPACTTVCTPGTSTCAFGTVTACSADGMSTTTSSCPLGCSGTKCATLTPSNLPANVCDTPGTATLAATGYPSIDTSTGCDLVVTQGAGAPEICVRKYATVSSFGTMTVRGPRALAIVATSSMTLSGSIDASALGGSPGAGASDPRGAAPADAMSAGAGAGGVTAGAPGPLGGAGGAPYGASNATPLLAGAAGGQGAGNYAPVVQQGYGGAGGGALQLVSCGDLTVTNASTVRADGGGGAAGQGTMSNAGSGGGGGSGGTILIEAVKVLVAAPSGSRPSLSAAGGGGGSGGAKVQGGLDGVGQTGGAPVQSYAGAGGDGGGGGAAPVSGARGATGPDGIFVGGNGGSGGSQGRIRINTAGSNPDLSSVIVTGAVSIGVVNTH